MNECSYPIGHNLITAATDKRSILAASSLNLYHLLLSDLKYGIVVVSHPFCRQAVTTAPVHSVWKTADLQCSIIYD